MKKVTVTIKIEKTIMIEFDEQIIDQEVINNYVEYFDGHVEDIPEEISFMCDDDLEKQGITDDDFAYMNIAKNIAHMYANYDISKTEGVGKIQDMAYSSKRNNPGGIYLTEVDNNQEFEFELDQCEFNQDPLNQVEE